MLWAKDMVSPRSDTGLPPMSFSCNLVTNFRSTELIENYLKVLENPEESRTEVLRLIKAVVVSFE
jgi:hypothetical protein